MTKWSLSLKFVPENFDSITIGDKTVTNCHLIFFVTNNLSSNFGRKATRKVTEIGDIIQWLKFVTEFWCKFDGKIILT